MKNINKFLILFIITSISSSLKYEDDIESNYELLDYLSIKTYKLDRNDTNEMLFRLKMDINKIKTDSTIYINIHQRNPETISFKYYIGKNDTHKNFRNLNEWITTNSGKNHILYYQIDKPNNQDYYLYMKIVVSNYNINQYFSVESVDGQFNFYLLIGLIIGFSALLVFVIIFLIYYSLYKFRISDIKDNNNYTFNTVFAKVGPEDF